MFYDYSDDESTEDYYDYGQDDHYFSPIKDLVDEHLRSCGILSNDDSTSRHRSILTPEELRQRNSRSFPRQDDRYLGPAQIQRLQQMATGTRDYLDESCFITEDELVGPSFLVTHDPKYYSDDNIKVCDLDDAEKIKLFDSYYQDEDGYDDLMNSEEEYISINTEMQQCVRNAVLPQSLTSKLCDPATTPELIDDVTFDDFSTEIKQQEDLTTVDSLSLRYINMLQHSHRQFNIRLNPLIYLKPIVPIVVKTFQQLCDKVSSAMKTVFDNLQQFIHQNEPRDEKAHHQYYDEQKAIGACATVDRVRNIDKDLLLRCRPVVKIK